MSSTASPGNSNWIRSPTVSQSSYYSQRTGRRPLPNPPNSGGFARTDLNAPEPPPVPARAVLTPPLQAPTSSHTNVFLDRFVGGFRRYVMSKRPTLPAPDLEAHTGRTPVPFPTTPYPEQYYEYDNRHTRTVTTRNEGDGDRRMYTTDDTLPEPSNMLLSVPGPAIVQPSRSPSMLSPQSFVPRSIAPHPSRTPSIHHSLIPSMHPSLANNALSVQVGQPSRSRTSSTGRFDRHSSRAPSEDPVDGGTDGDGEGDVATAVGHSEGAALSIQRPASTNYLQQNYSQGIDNPVDEIKPPESQAQPGSPYSSTFALIIAAFHHVCNLPFTAPVITKEWTAPIARTVRPSQADSWYSHSARDGLYPGAPRGANVYPPALPITATMSLSPGIMPPPNAFYIEGRPWQAGMPYYYPQHRDAYEPSTAPPPSMMQQDYSGPPAMPTPSLTLLNAPTRHLQAPSIHPPPSTYRSTTPAFPPPPTPAFPLSLTPFAHAH